MPVSDEDDASIPLNTTDECDGDIDTSRSSKSNINTAAAHGGPHKGALRFVFLAIAFATVVAVACVAVLHPNFSFHEHPKINEHGVISLSAKQDIKRSCAVPKNFCKENPNREDKLSYRDCDGDGILDPFCEGGELLRFGYISSKNNCQNNWPNGVCVEEVQPGADKGEFGQMAAGNEITVIHFNDVYEVAGILEGGVRRGGMSRAAHVVNQERKRNPDRTFAVFAGDLLSPSVLSNLFEGEQMIDILNQMKIDAASLGNHEFDFGVDVLSKRLNESQFPWLNINLFNEHGQILPGTTRRFMKEVPFTPRWARDKDAHTTSKVCFFGVAYDVRETMFKDKSRVRHRDVINASQEEVRYLRDHEKCDVVVPLTHQFSHHDCELAKSLRKGVDLILGGHDHSTEFTSVCGHAPYVKAASDLKSQWVMTLWLDEHGKVDSVDGRLLSLTDEDPFDIDIHNNIVAWESRGETKMGQRIGCSAVDLDAHSQAVRSKETPIGNFFTDAMKSMHKTDVAIFNGGGIRGNKVYAKGDISKQRIMRMHPFGNLIITIWVTGKQLREEIESGLECYDSQCGEFVSVSGLKLKINTNKPRGHRLVSLLKADGSVLGDDDRLSLAISDYMLSKSKFKSNKLYNMVTKNDAVPLLQALFQAIEKAGDSCISPQTDGRIELLGDDPHPLHPRKD